MAGTNPAQLDQDLWDHAGIEREHLRSIHSDRGVTLIRDFLKSWLPNYLHSVRSVWIDARPLCHVQNDPLLGNKMVELGDLAIIVRRATAGGFQRRMWILQGKMTGSDPFGNSQREVALYEPATLWTALEIYQSAHRGKTSARLPSGRQLSQSAINLYAEFARMPALSPPMWSYLMFERTSGTAMPIYSAWPSAQHWNPIAGFADGLLAMSREVGKGGSYYGADLVSGKAWHKVYGAIRRCHVGRAVPAAVRPGSNASSPGARHTIGKQMMMTVHDVLQSEVPTPGGVLNTCGEPKAWVFDRQELRHFDTNFDEIDLPALVAEHAADDGFVVLMIDQFDESTKEYLSNFWDDY